RGCPGPACASMTSDCDLPGGCSSAVEPEPAAAEPIVIPTGRPPRLSGAEVGPEHRGAEVVQLGGDDGPVRPAGEAVDEAGQAGVLPQPEEGRPGAEPREGVELADGERDGQRVWRVVEEGLAVGLQVGGRLTVGDDEDRKSGV